LDKRALIQASTGGLAFLQDCALPIALGNWTYESQLMETYYSPNIAKANATLDAAGFRDLNGNGWRDYDADNSTTLTSGDILDVDFVTDFLYTAGYAPAGNAVRLAVESLGFCGIMAEEFACDYYCWMNDLWGAEPHFGCFVFTNMVSPDLLYDLFHSCTGNNQWYFGGWTNTTYDLYAENLMTAQTKEEANHWAWKCQEILWYEQPMIVCYNDVISHVFREDIWEGYINMACRNRMGDNPWTLRRLRLKENSGGPWGCYPTEYIMSLTDGIDTTNILMSNSKHTNKVLSQIYNRLWQFDPYTWEPVPDLAHTWDIEPTNRSGDIQDGEKYTFYLYENATWHDGTPLTATDVANSVSLAQLDLYNSENYENIYLTNILNNSTVEIYSNKTGYFEWTHSTGFTVLPWHIWSHIDNITAWEPATPLELTGSGPFQWGHRIPGQYITLTLFTDYHFAVEQPPRTFCPSPIPLVLYVLVSLGIIVVIIQVCVLCYLLQRRSKNKSMKNSMHRTSSGWRVD
jgi:ABC-type transport system substrate-binding protein